jgi:hypothetical protein
VEIVSLRIKDKTQGIEKAKRDGYIYKSNKGIGNIGKRYLVLFLQITYKYRKDKRDD